MTGWGGHWRGENATEETVICPLSYETRKPLDGLCAYGYTVANGALNFYFASDLIHRIFHMPSQGEGVVDHYADDYNECVELALTSPEDTVRNTHTLQYFALDVYAYDIALPGDVCTGKVESEQKESEVVSATTAEPAASTTVVNTPVTTVEDIAATQTPEGSVSLGTISR